MELKDHSEPPACRSSRPRPQPKKKKEGARKDCLNKADNTTLARAGELPIPIVWIEDERSQREDLSPHIG
jgi:hypothetical protein